MVVQAFKTLLEVPPSDTRLLGGELNPPDSLFGSSVSIHADDVANLGHRFRDRAQSIDQLRLHTVVLNPRVDEGGAGELEALDRMRARVGSDEALVRRKILRAREAPGEALGIARQVRGKSYGLCLLRAKQRRAAA